MSTERAVATRERQTYELATDLPGRGPTVREVQTLSMPVTFGQVLLFGRTLDPAQIAAARQLGAGRELRLTIGANESSTLYLLAHIERYRRRYPKIKVQIRRSLSSKIPTELLDGDLDLPDVVVDDALGIRPPADARALPRQRRRAADRQVQADLPGELTA